MKTNTITITNKISLLALSFGLGLLFVNTNQLQGQEQYYNYNYNYNAEQKKVKQKIIETCREENVNQFLFLAIAERESDFGLTLVNGKGDKGNGFGVFQLDKRYHSEFLNKNDWRDVKVSCRYAIKLYKANEKELDYHINGSIAAYNCGASNVKKAWRNGKGHDYYTTGKDYARDVIGRMRKFRKMFAMFSVDTI